MSEKYKLNYLIEEDDIFWKMDYEGLKRKAAADLANNVNVDWANKTLALPDEEEIFEQEHALAHMLINNIVFINEHWWEKDWPEQAKKTIAICVNCNDSFAYAAADAEGIYGLSNIETLYRMWRKDPRWGHIVWCAQQRKYMPIPPIEDEIREEGIWDLDSMNLKENHWRKLKREKEQANVASENKN